MSEEVKRLKDILFEKEISSSRRIGFISSIVLGFCVGIWKGFWPGVGAFIGLLIIAVVQVPKIEIIRAFKRISRLAHAGNKEAVSVLAEYLKDGKRKGLKTKVRETLSSLTSQQAIDRLCEIWEKDRNGLYEEIITHCAYVASQPLRLKVLTALKLNRLDLIEEIKEQAVSEFISASHDKDPEISQRAVSLLKTGLCRKVIWWILWIKIFQFECCPSHQKEFYIFCHYFINY